ncbi:MAG: hypothetical protein AVDCRST_MAG69-934, partial [uncultured Solirubrobacteraceae bacterium]
GARAHAVDDRLREPAARAARRRARRRGRRTRHRFPLPPAIAASRDVEDPARRAAGGGRHRLRALQAARHAARPARPLPRRDHRRGGRALRQARGGARRRRARPSGRRARKRPLAAHGAAVPGSRPGDLPPASADRGARAPGGRPGGRRPL